MTSSIGLSTASTFSTAYDLTVVKHLVGTSTLKAAHLATTALLPLCHTMHQGILQPGASTTQLAEVIEFTQSTQNAQIIKKRLQNDAKVQFIFTKLSITTMEQMQFPIKNCAKTPLETLMEFITRVHGDVAGQFFDTNVLPFAIELLATLKKYQPAALDALDRDEFWEISSNKHLETTEDEKKV